MRALFAFLGAAVIGAGSLEAQSCGDPAPAAPVLGGAWQRTLRADELRGGARRGHAGFLGTHDLLAACPGDGVRAAPAVVRAVGNSAFAVDRYEGALWAGRGIGTWATGGVSAAFGPVRIDLMPEWTWQQNREFRTVDHTLPRVSPEAYPFTTSIDWPQRHGSGAFTRVEPGASRIALVLGTAEIGLSGQNLWLGPALRYPLLLSNAAAGFPHFYARSPRLEIGSTTIEAALLLGRLSESAYYDADASNDYRSLSGFTLTVRPASGLVLGGALLRHRESDRVPPLSDLFSFARSPFAVDEGATDRDNGLASIFASWTHTASGFGVHAEWGREDFLYDLEYALADPEYSSAYTLGLTKAGRWGSRDLLLLVEITELGTTRTTWYTNEHVPQGHTHRGQLLGAYVGPGSSAQFVALDLVGSDGARWSPYLERVRWDEFRYQQDFAALYSFWGYDVEVRGGVGHGRRIGPLVLDASAGVGFRRNRNFLNLDRWTFDWEPNWELDVALSWIPAAPPAAARTD